MFFFNAFFIKFSVFFFAKLVATDQFGNKYYEYEKRKDVFGRKKRVCVYNGLPDSSRVPVVLHSWLHHNQDNIAYILSLRKKFIKNSPIVANLSGTNHQMDYNSKYTAIRSVYSKWTPIDS